MVKARARQPRRAAPPPGRQGKASKAAVRPETRPGTRAERKPARARKLEPEARRQAILQAALHVFAEHGFEAARLEDVAARAGVAKGTLYLYFDNKEALFEALIRNAVSPIMDAVGIAAAAPGASPAKVIETFFALFEKEVLGTDRKLLLRLILAEGPRFPAIAEFYYREVVSRGLALMRGLAEHAVQQGEFATDAPMRYPQLIIAPLLVAVLWDGLFAGIEPLNVGGLLRAHREVLAGNPRKGQS